jgi:hypothetical protein
MPVEMGSTSGSMKMSSTFEPVHWSRARSPARDRELAVGRPRHRGLLILVDRADHQRRVVRLREPADLVELLLPVLEVRRVDDALARRMPEPASIVAICVESIISGASTCRTSRLTTSPMSRALSRPA